MIIYVRNINYILEIKTNKNNKNLSLTERVWASGSVLIAASSIFVVALKSKLIRLQSKRKNNRVYSKVDSCFSYKRNLSVVLECTDLTVHKNVKQLC